MTPLAALQATAQAWLQSSRAAMEVQVLRTRGSVPREAGTRMLVAADAVAGSIGGGHLEWQAIAEARAQLLADQADSSAIQDRPIALGPTLGQCCGGTLTLRTQRLTAHSLQTWPAAQPLFDVQIYGAGHVGQAIVQLLQAIDCRVQWIDERDAQFPPTVDAPHIQRLCVDAVQAEVAQAAPGAFYLVLTHSHELDLAITEAILHRADFAWLGLIGSATKRARFVHRFEQRGLTPEVINRITCPIGLTGIAGKQPEVIALAVVAQMLQGAGSRASA